MGNSKFAIAPIPCTGSNTLKKRISESLKWKAVNFKHTSGIGHLCIYPLNNLRGAISVYLRHDRFICQHFLPTQKNHRYLSILFRSNRPKVISTTRNIFDLSASLFRHKLNSGRYPLGYDISDGDGSLSNDEMLTDSPDIFHVLFCMKYYIGWYRASKTRLGDVKFVAFEDIQGSNKKLDHELSEFLGLDLHLDGTISENKRDGTKLDFDKDY